MSTGSTKQRRMARVGLSKHAEVNLRVVLRRTAPSEPWVDAQFRSVECEGDDRVVVRRIHDPRAFPPGGAKTAMRRCPQCGVMTPPFAFEGGVCLDHAEHGNWGRSPSATAIAALQRLHLRLVDPPLPSESITALRAEISDFHKTLKGRGKLKPRRGKKPAPGKSGGRLSPGRAAGVENG